MNFKDLITLDEMFVAEIRGNKWGKIFNDKGEEIVYNDLPPSEKRALDSVIKSGKYSGFVQITLMGGENIKVEKTGTGSMISSKGKGKTF